MVAATYTAAVQVADVAAMAAGMGTMALRAAAPIPAASNWRLTAGLQVVAPAARYFFMWKSLFMAGVVAPISRTPCT